MQCHQTICCCRWNQKALVIPASDSVIINKNPLKLLNIYPTVRTVQSSGILSDTKTDTEMAEKQLSNEKWRLDFKEMQNMGAYELWEG